MIEVYRATDQNGYAGDRIAPEKGEAAFAAFLDREFYGLCVYRCGFDSAVITRLDLKEYRFEVVDLLIRAVAASCAELVPFIRCELSDPMISKYCEESGRIGAEDRDIETFLKCCHC